MPRVTPLYTQLYDLRITYPPATEFLYPEPKWLPTTEPADPQISYTVAESDLPTFNIGVYRVVYVAVIVAGGKCNASATVYWRMLRNNVSLTSGSATVSAGFFYTRMFFFYNIQVGDKLDVKLWANLPGTCYLDYEAYQILVTRLIPLERIRLLHGLHFASFTMLPALMLGNPFVINTALRLLHADSFLITISDVASYPSLYVGPTIGMFQLHYGDYAYRNSSLGYTSSTYRPYYLRQYQPTRILFRGVRLD